MARKKNEEKIESKERVDEVNVEPLDFHVRTPDFIVLEFNPTDQQLSKYKFQRNGSFFSDGKELYCITLLSRHS